MSLVNKVPIRLGRLRTSVRDTQPTATGAADIRVHSSANEPSQQLLLRTAASGRVCRVCTTHESRYTCPRCNLPYCSVDCYRSHGATCTEQFYQEHVANEMAFDERATASVDPKAQRQRVTQELLTRVKQFHDETSRAFDGSDAIAQETTADDTQMEWAAERLAELAQLDDAELSLDCLTLEERTRFLADVTGGRLSKYVMPWDPWWQMRVDSYEMETSARRRNLIVDVSGQDHQDDAVHDDAAHNEEEDEDTDDFPSADNSIQVSRFPAALFTNAMAQSMPSSLRSLVRGAVSPSLPFHLVELLFAYAFTMRTFNGDWRQDPPEAALTLLHYSDVLSNDARFPTLDQVAIKCLEQRDQGGATRAATNRLVLADVAQLLSHQLFVLDALTDMKQLLHDAAKEIRSTTRPERATAKKPFHAVEKKIEFYRVWRCRAEATQTTDLLEVANDLRTKLDALRSVRGQ